MQTLPVMCCQLLEAAAQLCRGAYLWCLIINVILPSHFNKMYHVTASAVWDLPAETKRPSFGNMRLISISLLLVCHVHMVCPFTFHSSSCLMFETSPGVFIVRSVSNASTVTCTFCRCCCQACMPAPFLSAVSLPPWHYSTPYPPPHSAFTLSMCVCCTPTPSRNTPCRSPLVLLLLWPLLLLLPREVDLWVTDLLTVRQSDNRILTYKQRVHNLPTLYWPVRYVLGMAISWGMMYLLHW